MGKVWTGLSVSVDGFLAGTRDSAQLPLGVGGRQLFDWLGDGDTPSRYFPDFRMSAASVEVFDEAAGRTGAVLAGRRTYEVSGAWGGHGPMAGVPLFVLTHRAPDQVPTAPGAMPYTFVTTGVADAVEQARGAAGDKNVGVMGARAVQECLNAGLLDEITLHQVPVLLGQGVRLLDNLQPGHVELVRVVDAPGVTHLTYRIPR